MMVTLGMILILAIFTVGMLWTIRQVVRCYVEEDLEELALTQKRYEALLIERAQLDGCEKKLEEEAAHILTLYELTKDMTKTFVEDQVLGTFKAHVAKNLSLSDVVLLDPLAEEALKLKEKEGYGILNLSSQRRNLGYLAVKHIRPQDAETLKILANQVALALQRVRLYQDIERLSMTDSLTDVHTRRYVMERFEEERLRAQTRRSSMAFVMVDIDFFKRINDIHGHLTGDQVLREIALLIKANIREIDFVGRYGGEEFCVVLPDTDQANALYVASRIRQAVEQSKIRAFDTVIQTTVSIGVAVFPQDGQTSAELIDKADWALYRAKKQGRNQVCAFNLYSA